MENFEIQNHLGEVIVESISREELDVLLEAKELNYFEYDATEENNLVTRWAQAKIEDETLNMDMFRIYKHIGE